jgi:site-specific recombinase XerD
MSNSLSDYISVSTASTSSNGSSPGTSLTLVLAPARDGAVGRQQWGVEANGLMDNPGDEHPAAVYLARLSRGSRDTMAQALNVIAAILTAGTHNMRTMPWSVLRYQHTAAVRAELAERYAPATANKMLAALRGVLKEAWRLGQMSAEDYHRAADTPTVRGSILLKGRALGSGEILALFGVCAADRTAIGARDAAMLAVLYNCGLRRSELVALALSDYSEDEGSLHVRNGTGNKARLVYVSPGAQEALLGWLVVRGQYPGPLFCAINRHATIQQHGMTGQSVRKMLVKRGTQAGLAPFSPHDLRRTMIGDLLDAGADISTVQRVAGHANVTTTTRYDRRNEGVKRQAACLLNVPYIRQSG